ncbi:MAG: class I SAM-dependent rRNA methyltransferase [Spirochaetaceae bacterium]|jgi:23S rRNA (cytosine1962-C5)-methyltransferase|nr:class I SAM-dependent rRNA methyltransferase [Spirochaetaceae bacterium]
MSIKRILLHKGEEDRILDGHPWVYDNEIDRVLTGKGEAAVPCVLEGGDCADVESSNKRYLGRAFVNPASKIRARLYSRSKEGADAGFFKRRIREAALRKSFLGGETSFRLIFGEADFLPGVIIDRYVGWRLKAVEAAMLKPPLNAETLAAALGPPESFYAVQFLCAGTEARRELIVEALVESSAWLYSAPAAVVEKPAVSARALEGLPPSEGLLYGALEDGGIVIFEHGCPFVVDMLDGQKTGFFLDQRDNHRAAAAYAVNKRRVLDAFCYSGGFAVHCAKAGGEEVLAADSSESALKLVEKNAVLAGVRERITTRKTDIFKLLTELERAKERFDMIILDPPAFAKTKNALSGALAGYKEINLKALSLLNPAGVLVSCSCSYALNEERFKAMIHEAALDAGRRVIEAEFRGQAACHSVLYGYGESRYLKCGVYIAV